MVKLISTRYGNFPERLTEDERRIRYREWLKRLPPEELANHLWNHQTTALDRDLSPEETFRHDALSAEYQLRVSEFMG